MFFYTFVLKLIYLVYIARSWVTGYTCLAIIVFLPLLFSASLCRFVLFLPEMFGSTNSSVESSRPYVLFSGRCLHIDLTDIRLFKCISFLWLLLQIITNLMA